MKKFWILLAAWMAFAAAPALLATPALAALQVDVTQGNAQPLPIAIPDFVGGGPGDAQAGANIAGVIRADLERSGLFRPLDPKGFTEHVSNINTVPTFGNWRSINAQGLLTGQATQQPDGRLRVDFRCGMSMAKARCWACSSSPRPRTGGASPIWCRTRSMSASPARRAISTPASSSSPNPVR